MQATSNFECHSCENIVHKGDPVYVVNGQLHCAECAPR